MKIVKPLGITGALLVLSGGLFKLQHWPGASIMILLGILFCIFYLFYWLSESRKTMSSSKEKTAQTLLFVLMILTAVGAVFKIQHWPGAAILVMGHLALLILVFIPVYLVYLSSETDENRKNSRFAFFIFYLGITGVFLARGGSSAFIMNTFTYPDRAIMAMNDNMVKHNGVLYEKAMADSSVRDKAARVKELSDNLVQHINLLKIYLLKETDPDFAEMPEDSISLAKINHKDNFDIPTIVLIGNDPENPRQDANSAAELKNKILNYRQEMLNLLEEKHGADYIGLKTENSSEEGKTVSWETRNFFHVPISVVIIALDQLQNEVRYAESVALGQLTIKQN